MSLRASWIRRALSQPSSGWELELASIANTGQPPSMAVATRKGEGPQARDANCKRLTDQVIIIDELCPAQRPAPRWLAFYTKHKDTPTEGQKCVSSRRRLLKTVQ